MIEPAIPKDEKQRLETLNALKILDSAPEERFDRITRMAKRMFGVPISLVSLVDSDRQWFKSKQGLDADETPRNISFCGHAILGDEVFDIPNALKDERFHDNPLVTDAPHIRFYAGHPLKAVNGHKLGTICLIDQEPHNLNEDDKLLLRDLALMIEQEIASIQLATIDELTALSNRRGFTSLATHLLANSARHKQPISLLFFDLNKFKPINDTFGHAEGDRALIAFSNCMREVFRLSDAVCRLGGDEFVALLSDTNEQQCEIALERFKKTVDEYNEQAKRGYNIEYSVGTISITPDASTDINELLQQADEKMYESKQRR